MKNITKKSHLYNKRLRVAQILQTHLFAGLHLCCLKEKKKAWVENCFQYQAAKLLAGYKIDKWHISAKGMIFQCFLMNSKKVNKTCLPPAIENLPIFF